MKFKKAFAIAALPLALASNPTLANAEQQKYELPLRALPTTQVPYRAIHLSTTVDNIIYYEADEKGLENLPRLALKEVDCASGSADFYEISHYKQPYLNRQASVPEIGLYTFNVVNMLRAETTTYTQEDMFARYLTAGINAHQGLGKVSWNDSTLYFIEKASKEFAQCVDTSPLESAQGAKPIELESGLKQQI